MNSRASGSGELVGPGVEWGGIGTHPECAQWATRPPISGTMHVVLYSITSLLVAGALLSESL